MVVCNLLKGCLADSPLGLKRRYFTVFGRAGSLHNDSQRKHYILKRFSTEAQSAASSLIVSFFTQRARHPQVKSSITKRKDGLIIEGRRSCTRRDLELEESIFQSSSNSFLSDTQNNGTLWKKARKIWSRDLQQYSFHGLVLFNLLLFRSFCFWTVHVDLMNFLKWNQ